VRGETGAAVVAPDALAKHLGMHAEDDVSDIMYALARFRAQACVDALVSHGVSESQLYVSASAMGGSWGVHFIPQGAASASTPSDAQSFLRAVGGWTDGAAGAPPSAHAFANAGSAPPVAKAADFLSSLDTSSGGEKSAPSAAAFAAYGGDGATSTSAFLASVGGGGGGGGDADAFAAYGGGAWEGGASSSGSTRGLGVSWASPVASDQRPAYGTSGAATSAPGVGQSSPSRAGGGETAESFLAFASGAGS
jgi:hypothetical protein